MSLSRPVSGLFYMQDETWCHVDTLLFDARVLKVSKPGWQSPPGSNFCGAIVLASRDATGWLFKNWTLWLSVTLVRGSSRSMLMHSTKSNSWISIVLLRLPRRYSSCQLFVTLSHLQNKNTLLIKDFRINIFLGGHLQIDVGICHFSKGASI